MSKKIHLNRVLIENSYQFWSDFDKYAWDLIVFLSRFIRIPKMPISYFSNLFISFFYLLIIYLCIYLLIYLFMHRGAVAQQEIC